MKGCAEKGSRKSSWKKKRKWGQEGGGLEIERPVQKQDVEGCFDGRRTGSNQHGNEKAAEKKKRGKVLQRTRGRWNRGRDFSSREVKQRVQRSDSGLTPAHRGGYSSENEKRFRARSIDRKTQSFLHPNALTREEFHAFRKKGRGGEKKVWKNKLVKKPGKKCARDG